jgi:DNA repair exonuclease SbcCD ATPase subunit
MKGVILVKGANGAGKTTMFSALCWVLYRVNLNDTNNDAVQTWEHLRPDDYRGTRVVLDFKVGDYDYRIARHINFKGTTLGLKGGSKLMIFKKHTEEDAFDQSHMIGEEQHKKDQQGYIERLVGLDSRMFLNSVLFGQRMSRLVSASNDEKRKLFDTLFELDFVELAKERAKEAKVTLEQSMSKLESRLAVLENQTASLREQYDRDKELLENFDVEKKKRVAAVKQELDEVKQELKEADKEVKALEKKQPKDGDDKKLEKLQEAVERDELYLKKDKETLNNATARYEKAVREHNTSLQKSARLEQEKAEVSDTCPTCEQPIQASKLKKVKAALDKQIKDEDKVQKAMEEEKNQALQEQAEAEQKVETTKGVLADSEKALKEYKDSKAGEQEAVFALRAKKGERDRLEASKDKIEARLKEEKAAEPPKVDLNKTITQINDNVAETKKLDKDLAAKQEELERVQWWITKGFGSGGIKAFVFNAMLNQLNEYVKKYASRLGYRVKFTVDMESARKSFITRCYKGDREVDYADFSGGQKQRVDVCLAFAMHDLVSSTRSLSILVMDEIFEGLDDEGIETVFDLIRVKAGDGAGVYVITHSTMIDSLNAKTVWIEQDMETEATLIR